jgi:site-specific DNA-adenine methylase
MVYYLGSKFDHANEILKIVLAKRTPGQTFVEPFVGGGRTSCAMFLIRRVRA